jgi:regulator of RNase E activity RraA
MPRATIEQLDHLRQYDTPTIWNALGTLRGRKLTGFTRGPMVVSHTQAKPMVGYAVTAKLLSSAPADRSAEEQLALRNAYYRHLGASPRPAVVVIEDWGPSPGLGAFWGEVNSAIHRGLGMAGVLTNGAVRDMDALDEALPILAGTICLSNGMTNLTEIDVPVTVFGLHIRPGDLLHADRHGAMVIPPEYVDALPDAITGLLAREREVIAHTSEPGFDAERMIEVWKLMEGRH